MVVSLFVRTYVSADSNTLKPNNTMKHVTKTGQIPASVGFSQTAGTIRKLTKAEKKAQKDLQKTR